MLHSLRSSLRIYVQEESQIGVKTILVVNNDEMITAPLGTTLSRFTSSTRYNSRIFTGFTT